MDISKLGEVVAQDEAPVAVVIYQKDGNPYLSAEGKPCTISVVGSESKRYRDAQRASTRRALRQRRTTMEVEDFETNEMSEVVAAVTDWYGWELDGMPAPCTRENVRMLLGARHIFDQVKAGITGHADFFKQQSGT